MKTYNCYFDGACEPCNPGGDIGMGIYITDGVNEFRYGKKLDARPENTNNIAEYGALICILRVMSNKKNCQINIYGDSMLVIKQMCGDWSAKKGAYLDYHFEAKRMIEELKKHNQVSFTWIPREKNEKADYESIKALGFNRTPR